MSRIKRNLAKLVMVIISGFIGVVFVELTLRIVNSKDPWSKTFHANILRNVQYTYDKSPLYNSDQSSHTYVRNEYGLRDTCNSPSEIEILTIGGSTTDQRFVEFSSTYQTVIEKRLKELNNSFGCVSNAGVDGHSTWGHLFSFEHWFPLIPELKPKIILLYIGVNDADFFKAEAPNPGDDYISQGGVKAFLASFDLVKALLPIWRLMRQNNMNVSRAYGSHSASSFTDDDYTINVINQQTDFLSEENAKSFRLRLSLILKEIYALDATPLCVTQPHRYVMEKEGVMYGVRDILGDGFSGIDYDYSIRRLNNEIFQLCGDNTLDLYSQEFSRSHFYDGIHTTATGSEQIGEIIAEFIISKFY